MWTTFLGSNQKYYIDYMVLKWGSNHSVGSDHVIGGRQAAGEVSK